MLMDGFSFYSGFGKPRPVPTTSGTQGYRVQGVDNYDFYLRTGTLKDFARLMGDSIRFWKTRIEETDPDYKRVWRQRTLFQQIVNFPPDMITEAVVAGGASTSTTGRATYMMMDQKYHFERTIFSGVELDLLVFDVLVFCLTDFGVQSPTVAAVVTYLVAFAIAVIRQYFGERNITYKTMIDGRFLK